MQILHNLSIWYLLHPTQNPNLNAIEHLWWKLKKLIHKITPELRTIKKNKPTKKKTLKAAIKTAFNQLTTDPEWDLPAILAHSIPKQLAAVKLIKKKKN